MRLVRVMRILRIFKLVRHFAGLQSLLYTLKQAYKELGLLVILVAVAVLTFSSLVFYAEKDSPELKWTFLDSFWWGLMTLTTGKQLMILVYEVYDIGLFSKTQLIKFHVNVFQQFLYHLICLFSLYIFNGEYFEFFPCVL